MIFLHTHTTEKGTGYRSGVTKSGRVWRKVPESDPRSVTADLGT